MTARARRLLAALEDGPRTRAEIFDLTGYMLSNNSASELRREGFTVVCSRRGREYVYEIVDGALSGAVRVAPTLPVACCATAKTSGPAESTVEHEDGQLAFAVAA